jgi:broad specificity phosphatase PhoE
MANQVLLIRPGTYKGMGLVLAGRGGTPLSVIGRTQSHALSASLANAKIRMVGHSPSFRAQVTAKIIAYVHDLEVQEIVALDDVEFGAWRGRTLSELEQQAEWQGWHADPDNARCPAGETIKEAGARLLSVLDGLPAHPDGIIVLVTHANMIRAALATILGCSFAIAMRFDIAPASITELREKKGNWQVGGVNLRSGHGLTAPTDFGRWPADREAIGEAWAPDGKTRLGL